MILPRSLVVPHLFACVLLGPALRAENLPTAPASAAPAQPLPAKFREAIAAKLPKYAPQEQRPTTAKPDDSRPPIFSGTARLHDEPPEGVIRLPGYRVEEPRLRGITENTFLTEKGRLDAARRNFPGLGLDMNKKKRRMLEMLLEAVVAQRITFQVFGRGGDAQESRALEMLQEEKLAHDRADLADKLAVSPPGLPDGYSRETERLMLEATTPPRHAGNDPK